MVNRVFQKIPAKIWVFGLWAVFIIHDLEEVFTMSRFSRDHLQQLPGVIRAVETKLIVSTPEMAIAVGVLIFIMFIVAMNVVRYPESGSWIMIWGMVVGILLANGLTHGIQAIGLGIYTPGSITGVMLELPATLLSLAWLKQTKKISTANLVLYVLLGFPLELVFVALSLSLSKVLI